MDSARTAPGPSPTTSSWASTRSWPPASPTPTSTATRTSSLSRRLPRSAPTKPLRQISKALSLHHQAFAVPIPNPHPLRTFSLSVPLLLVVNSSLARWTQRVLRLHSGRLRPPEQPHCMFGHLRHRFSCCCSSISGGPTCSVSDVTAISVPDALLCENEASPSLILGHEQWACVRLMGYRIVTRLPSVIVWRGPKARQLPRCLPRVHQSRAQCGSRRLGRARPTAVALPTGLPSCAAVPWLDCQSASQAICTSSATGRQRRRPATTAAAKGEPGKTTQRKERSSADLEPKPRHETRHRPACNNSFQRNHQQSLLVLPPFQLLPPLLSAASRHQPPLVLGPYNHHAIASLLSLSLDRHSPYSPPSHLWPPCIHRLRQSLAPAVDKVTSPLPSSQWLPRS